MKKKLTIVTLLLSAMCMQAQAQTREDYVAFLYQFMPQPDKTDYSRDFYEKT